jgi:excisionase family DNA binding protein
MPPPDRSRLCRTLSTSDAADRLGVSVNKILGWIHSRELRALNVAARPGGRPRWRISPEDLAAFEAARSARPAPPPRGRRRRLDPSVIEYF